MEIVTTYKTETYDKTHGEIEYVLNCDLWEKRVVPKYGLTFDWEPILIDSPVDAAAKRFCN